MLWSNKTNVDYWLTRRAALSVKVRHVVAFYQMTNVIVFLRGHFQDGYSNSDLMLVLAREKHVRAEMSSFTRTGSLI